MSQQADRTMVKVKQLENEEAKLIKKIKNAKIKLMQKYVEKHPQQPASEESKES
jgi:hypothetical protein